MIKTLLLTVLSMTCFTAVAGTLIALTSLLLLAKITTRGKEEGYIKRIVTGVGFEKGKEKNYILFTPYTLLTYWFFSCLVAMPISIVLFL